MHLFLVVMLANIHFLIVEVDCGQSYLFSASFEFVSFFQS